MRRFFLLVLVVAIVDVGPARAIAVDESCPPDEDPLLASGQDPHCFDWQGSWQQHQVTVPSRHADLAYPGTVFGPDPLPPAARYDAAAGNRDQSSRPLPAIVLMHGGGAAREQGLWWAARFLAGHGYVVVTATVLGDVEDYVIGVQSMVDFATSAANPLGYLVDPGRVGAAGHSQGARAVSFAQGMDDSGIAAVVAFDNLAANMNGDAGTALNCPVPVLGTRPALVVARVPAMGQAEDLPCPRNPSLDPEQKKAGYELFRSAGLPTALITFRGAHHFSWSHTPAQAVEDPELLELFARYAKVWFDRWLVGDETATEAFLQETFAGRSVDEVLSERYLSALHLPDEGIDCADLRACIRPQEVSP